MRNTARKASRRSSRGSVRQRMSNHFTDRGIIRVPWKMVGKPNSKRTALAADFHARRPDRTEDHGSGVFRFCRGCKTENLSPAISQPAAFVEVAGAGNRNNKEKVVNPSVTRSRSSPRRNPKRPAFQTFRPRGEVLEDR